MVEIGSKIDLSNFRALRFAWYGSGADLLCYAVH